ncbi:MAG: class I SAM-dependent methyltransferase [Tannerellaceae bacterium]
MRNDIKDFFDKMAPEWDTICKHDLLRIERILLLSRIDEGAKVLDVACGTGVLTPALLEIGAGEILGVDISEEMIKVAQSKFDHNAVRFEATDFMDVDEGDFDVAIVYNAYPHFLDKKSLVAKLYHVLKPGGRFVVAHSDSKEKINGCHHKLDSKISDHLLAVEHEADHFVRSFEIDTMIDAPDLYVLSGTRR